MKVIRTPARFLRIAIFAVGFLFSRKDWLRFDGRVSRYRYMCSYVWNSDLGITLRLSGLEDFFFLKRERAGRVVGIYNTRAIDSTAQRREENSQVRCVKCQPRARKYQERKRSPVPSSLVGLLIESQEPRQIFQSQVWYHENQIDRSDAMFEIEESGRASDLMQCTASRSRFVRG